MLRHHSKKLPTMSAPLNERRRFRRTDGSMLLIDAAPLVTMLGYRQTGRRDSEAGGVLLGRYVLDAPHVVVDEVTVPMKGDRRWLIGFRRGRDAHQKIIDKRWNASGGTCQYLGEWHTHPEDVPNASSVDRWDWGRRLRQDTFDANSLFFIIVGIEAVCVWEGTRCGNFNLLKEEHNQHYDH